MRRLIVALIAGACVVCKLWAQDAGTVDLSSGAVDVTSAAGSKQPALAGLGLNAGDTIETGGDGELHAVLADGGFLAIRSNTVVKIGAFSAKGEASDETWIDLLRGGLRAVTGWIAKSNPRAYRITTPAATIGVRGTDFDVAHIPEGQAGPGEMAGTHNWVHEGTTILKSQGGEIEVGARQAARVPSAVEAPRFHQGLPVFLERRQGKFEARIEEHARHIDERMTKSLRERGLLKDGESADRHIERSRMLHREEIGKERPGRETTRDRPSRREMPERPERHIR